MKAHALLSLPLSFAFATATQATGDPIPGDVLRAAKISNLEGGLMGQLDFSDQFGRSVTPVGDLDGDGVLDLIVGSHGDDEGGESGVGSDVGSVWVIGLRRDGSVRWNDKISATHGDFTGDLDDRDGFGRAVERMGDFDGDGVADVVVGASRDDDGGNNHGAIWVLFLRPDGRVESHQKISDTDGGFTGVLDDFDEFGRSMALVSDLDGDGVDDLVVGATGDGDGGTNRGAMWVLFLNADATVKAHQKISDLEGDFTGTLDNDDFFGLSACALGDLDGDGVDDIAVGAPKDDDGGTNTGALWILFLNTDGTVKAHQKISDTAGGFDGILSDRDEFGTSIASLGDVDGDGVIDLAIGSIRDSESEMDQGAVWVTFLNPDGTVKGTQKVNDEHGGFVGDPIDAFDWLGSSVCSLGDLDGDGKTDLASGARFDDDAFSDSGALWIIFLDGVSSLGETPALDGCGYAPANSLVYLGGDLTIDSAVEFGIDNPLGTQAPGGPTFLFFGSHPPPDHPCGTLIANFSMFGPGQQGEVLFDLDPARVGGAVLGAPWAGPGVPSSVFLDVPNTPSLIGTRVAVQGMIADPTIAFGVRLALTEGMLFELGAP